MVSVNIVSARSLVFARAVPQPLDGSALSNDQYIHNALNDPQPIGQVADEAMASDVVLVRPTSRVEATRSPPQRRSLHNPFGYYDDFHVSSVVAGGESSDGHADAPARTTVDAGVVMVSNAHGASPMLEELPLGQGVKALGAKVRALSSNRGIVTSRPTAALLLHLT